jgi:hypothetical protein
MLESDPERVISMKANPWLGGSSCWVRRWAIRRLAIRRFGDAAAYRCCGGPIRLGRVFHLELVRRGTWRMREVFIWWAGVNLRW